MKLLIILIAVFFVGCSTTPKYKFLHTEVEFKIKIVDKLPHKNGENELAQTECRPDFTECTIYIRKDVYPLCITHEVRHVLEGHWHNGNTTSGCRIDK